MGNSELIGKPLVVAVNKTDARDPSDLTPPEEALLQTMRDAGAHVVFMSTFTAVNSVSSHLCQ